jgi:thiamine-phosphate pyrophosphorylase
MRRELLPAVQIYLVMGAAPGAVSARSPAASLEDFLTNVIDAGVGMVQLREKNLSDRILLETARRVADVCRDNGALFIVNDRVDIALLSGADGVHVGQDDVHPDWVRQVAGEDFIIGVSTHSVEQVDAANSSCADYIGVGPIYETPTKPGRPAVGLELVGYAASKSRKPFFAIGGINAENASAVRAAGAQAISVVRYVADAADPPRAVRALLDALALGV